MKTRIAALVALLVIGLAVLLGPNAWARYRAREFTPVMREYVLAGTKGDSAALARVSIRPSPVRWALSVRQSEPELFPLAAAGLRPEMLRRADTGQVRLLFRFKHPFMSHGCKFPFDGIYTAFRQTPQGWRLVQAGLGPC